MPPVYVSAMGQDDNLGDSLLRRGYLRELRSRLGPLSVNVTGCSHDYVSGLGLDNADRVFVNARRWELSLMRDAARRRRPLLALNAGEARVTAHHEYIGRRLDLMARMVCAAGGTVVQSGLGVREAPDVVPSERLLRFLHRCSIVTWRDATTARSMGIGDVQPDWAFAVPATRAGERRDRLVVSMRVDRPLPNSEWVATVRRLQDAHGLRVVVASQVRRDDARLAELAGLLGADEILPWTAETHERRLDVLGDTYDRARFVVSDRLHALILGAMHGAVPLGLTTASAEKLRRTLAPAGLDAWSFDADQVSVINAIALPHEDEIYACVDSARQQLADVADLVLSAASPESERIRRER